MKSPTVFTSRTAVLANVDIDTDQIIPARFLTTTSRDGLGQHAFSEWRFNKDGSERTDFVLNQESAKGCSVLVAGDNFGCGSSREHAPWALLDYGFHAVISTSMADIFKSNALKNGLIPVIVDKNTHQWLLENPGAEVSVDIEQCELRIAGKDSIAFDIDSFARYCLLEGVDQLGFLLGKDTEIAAFESSHS